VKITRGMKEVSRKGAKHAKAAKKRERGRQAVPLQIVGVGLALPQKRAAFRWGVDSWHTSIDDIS
jgi:hypothetical protein